jgi:hypothetical protein
VVLTSSVIKNDLWAVLSSAPREVEGLILALKEGRVKGSTYTGECACLVGTIANVRGCAYTELGALEPDENRPIERFFFGIKEGDTPETNQFSALALEWAEEWLSPCEISFPASLTHVRTTPNRSYKAHLPYKNINMNTSPEIKNICAALVEFHKEIGKITKDSKNPFFNSKYASLSQILETIDQPLTDNGLAIMQFPEGENGLCTRLIHTSGEWFEACYVMRPAKNTPQDIGSTITYQRRYSVAAILSLNIDEDDDGNNGSGRGNNNGSTNGQAKPKQPAKEAQEPSVNNVATMSEAQRVVLQKMVDNATTLESLQTVYQDWPQYAKNKGFVDMVSARKAELVKPKSKTIPV